LYPSSQFPEVHPIAVQSSQELPQCASTSHASHVPALHHSPWSQSSSISHGITHAQARLASDFVAAQVVAVFVTRFLSGGLPSISIQQPTPLALVTSEVVGSELAFRTSRTEAHPVLSDAPLPA
jgi:hypothetical protein